MNAAFLSILKKAITIVTVICPFLGMVVVAIKGVDLYKKTKEQDASYSVTPRDGAFDPKKADADRKAESKVILAATRDSIDSTLVFAGIFLAYVLSKLGEDFTQREDRLNRQRALDTTLANINDSIMVQTQVNRDHTSRIAHDHNAGILERLNTLLDRRIYGEVISREEIYKRKAKCVEDIMAHPPISEAGFTVSVTSYRPDNPWLSGDEPTLKYHEAMKKYIQSNVGNVRRLMAVPHADKLTWVDEQLAFISCKFALRYQPAMLSKVVETVAPLIVDMYGDHLFITFVEEIAGDARNNKRLIEQHIYFRSPSLRSVFGAYYEAVWNSCSQWPIIENKRYRQDIVDLASAQASTSDGSHL